MNKKILFVFFILAFSNIFTNLFINIASASDEKSQDSHDFLRARELAMNRALGEAKTELDRVMDRAMDEYDILLKKKISAALDKVESSRRVFYKPTPVLAAGQTADRRQYAFSPSAWNIQPERSRMSKGGGGTNFISLRNTRNAIGVNFESESEKRQVFTSDLPMQRSRLLFEEVLETGFSGSVYHPNLVVFDANFENGLSQNWEKFQPTLTGKLKNSTLNRFHILSTFLRKKPYAFMLSADKARELENREFFERRIVNSTRYGGNFGLRNKLVPVNFTYSKTDRDILRASRPSQNYRDEEISLGLSNESDLIGQTRFEANQDDFLRAESDLSDQQGRWQSLNLSNQKYSLDNKKSLFSSIYLYDLSGTSESSILNWNESLDIEHTDHLSSSYNYSYSDKNSSGIETQDHRVGASLRHQLYDNLISTFTPSYFRSASSTFLQDTYGFALDENYTKRLGRLCKLNLGAGLAYSDEKRSSSEGVISIVDESITLTTGSITLLANPRVNLPTVVVTDLTGTITYTLNIDYQLSLLGESVQIERIPTGLITQGQQVLVDYHASVSPSSRVATLSNTALARIDFMAELIGIYYRSNKQGHPSMSGVDGLMLQKLDDSAFGVDIHPRNLRIEYEDQNYKSSLSPYKRKQLKESFFYNPSQRSTLTFQSSQSILRLTDTQRIQKFFDYIVHYSRGLSKYARLNFETGLRRQKGDGINSKDSVIGAGYELNFNKFLMSLKYNFQKQVFLNDRIINHLFFLNVKRIF